jgi:hypothetical protein
MMAMLSFTISLPSPLPLPAYFLRSNKKYLLKNNWPYKLEDI